MIIIKRKGKRGENKKRKRKEKNSSRFIQTDWEPQMTHWVHYRKNNKPHSSKVHLD